jgi:uncharacterized protein YbcI
MSNDFFNDEITSEYRIPADAIIREAMHDEITKRVGACPDRLFSDDKTEEQFVIFFTENEVEKQTSRK